MHLVKDILTVAKKWSSQKEFDDTKVQYLVSNGNTNPMPGL